MFISSLAYDSGRKAGFDGRNRANPYPAGSLSAKRWVKGFNAGKRDYEANLRYAGRSYRASVGVW